jgi:hypothetical protein
VEHAICFIQHLARNTRMPSGKKQGQNVQHVSHIIWDRDNVCTALQVAAFHPVRVDSSQFERCKTPVIWQFLRQSKISKACLRPWLYHIDKSARIANCNLRSTSLPCPVTHTDSKGRD